MKIIKLTTVLVLLLVGHHSVAQTYSHFYMNWGFTNPDGSNDRAYEDYCRGGTVWIENHSTYGSGSWPIPNLNGVYNVYKGNFNGPLLASIPASSFGFGQRYQIAIPSNLTFDYSTEGLNFYVHYTPAPSEYMPYAQPYRSKYLKTRTVSVNAGPDLTICSGQPISVSPTVSPSGAALTWSPNLPPTINTYFTSVTNTYTASATHTFYVGTLNPQWYLTCTATDAVNITAHPNPIIWNPQSYALCTGAPLPIITSASGMVMYQWRLNGSIIAGEISPSLNTALYGYGTYQCTFTNANGCKATQTIPVLLSNSAAVNLDPSFSSMITNPGSYGPGSLDIDLSSAYSGEHKWDFYTSNANGDLLVYLFSSGWSTSNNYSYDGIATNVYFAVRHNYRKAPCNEVVTAKRTFYETKRLNDDGDISVEETVEERVSVWSEPTDGVFTVVVDNVSAGTMNVTDMTGKIVYTTPLIEDSNAYQIDLSFCAKGMYIVNVAGGSKMHSEKIVVR